MPIRRGERSVHSAVAEPEEPGLVAVPVLAIDVIDRPVRVVVGGIALGHLRLTAIHADHLVVVVVRRVLRKTGPIPDHLKIPVPAMAGVDARVPFANLGRMITALPKIAGPEGALLRIVGAAGILPLHAHGLDAMLMMPGQDCRPRGHAPGTDVSPRETNTLRSQRIDIRRSRPLIGVLITPHRAMRLVIGVDEEEIDVRAGGLGVVTGDRETDQENEGESLLQTHEPNTRKWIFEMPAGRRSAEHAGKQHKPAQANARTARRMLGEIGRGRRHELLRLGSRVPGLLGRRSRRFRFWRRRLLRRNRLR